MLKGKNAVITGSRRGIGYATVKCFAENGANIWACMRGPDSQFDREMAIIAETYGVWIRPVYFDLTDEQNLKEKIRSIIKEGIPIDILVNNAGVAHGGTLLTTPLSKLKEVFDVNFFAQIHLMQYLAKYMLRNRSGSIINVASIGGLEANPGYLAYGSGKAAMIWATRSIAKELAPHGIRVNAVAPGTTNTDMGRYRSESEATKVLAHTPMGRNARPEEIADAIAFLASDKASYITGEILQVDGGRL